MKVVIIGAGAMGCRFGVALADAGADVTLCDVFEEHVRAVNEKGLKVTDNNGVRYVRIKATGDASMTDGADAFMIFTKSIHTKSALDAAAPALAGGAPVITLQNGLGNIEVLRGAVGKDRIIAGVTDYPSDFIGPGEVDIRGSGYVRMMALGSAGAAVAGEVCARLQKAGMNCLISGNIMKEIWEKLAFNCAMNTITGVTRQRVRYMGGSPHGFALCERIAGEVAQVAAAEGTPIDIGKVAAAFGKAIDPEGSGAHITSMLQDILAKRQTEIESIAGYVVKKAGEHGICAPYLETMYSLVKIIQENYPVML